jgi:hypothetical protein
MAAVLVLERKSVHVAKREVGLRKYLLLRSPTSIAARASVQRQAVAHLLLGSTLAEPGRLVRSCIALAMLTCARRAAMAVSAFQRSAPETES